MSISEYIELYNIIMNKHGWNNLYDNVKNNRKTFKYIDIHVDTRDGQIWCIKLRQGNNAKTFKGSNIKEKVINFLNESTDCKKNINKV